MTINSEVLALKYRPQTFIDLIGQDEIANSIYNSIKINKSHNAYLFTCIRGVGKTTFARILAKALNCEVGIEKLCQTNFCNSCKSIINSNHIDVLEIDGASHTGIDNIRELIEFSRYPPSLAKYKIFIIDEVHMLSKQAFNALLKTLEEPPKYLKFIFATTEIKKVPITIISRCQRYNLSRINSQELFDYLRSIAEKEKREVEDKALKLIVKISEGSVRDALSLLDRAFISNNEKILSFKVVQQIFGYVDKSSYIDLLEIIFKGDEIAALDHYRNLYNSGVDPNNFLNEFLEILYFIKNISFIQKDGSSFSLNDDEYKKILSLSKKLNTSTILLFWEFSLKTIKEINLVSNPNLSIEIFLIQLIYLVKKNSNKNSTINLDKESNTLEVSNIKNLKGLDAISQIKNVKQEEEEDNIEIKEDEKTTNINNLTDLINLCADKKEMELNYELENNVNLVSFSEKRIEIAFNENLNKNFVKDLSDKLYNWTKNRWIISLSKEKGEISTKEKKIKIKNEIMINYKKSKEYSNLVKLIPDIELIDLKKKND